MGIKTFKPTTPGRRQMVSLTYEEITHTGPEKSLIKRLKNNAGRNNQGKITIRHRGGGARRIYRMIDFKQCDKLNIPATVKTIEYDPNRSAFIMLVNYRDGEKRYHIAPADIKVGRNYYESKGKTKEWQPHETSIFRSDFQFTIWNSPQDAEENDPISRFKRKTRLALRRDGTRSDAIRRGSSH